MSRTTNSTDSKTDDLIVWIGDVLFQRPNRSLLYMDSGDLLLLHELSKWDELRPRLLQHIGLIGCFCFAIIFNFVLLFLSCTRKRRSYRHKSNCIVAALAFANIVLSCGFLLYTLIIDVYYFDVDSFDTLIQLYQNAPFGRIWITLKEIIHDSMVEEFVFVQTLLLLLLSIDRYIALFPSYNPIVKRKWAIFCLCILPYIIGLVVLNQRLLIHFLNGYTTKIVKYEAFSIKLIFELQNDCISDTNLFALVFTGCSVARNIQDAAISNPNHDLSSSISLLIILSLQLIEKCGIFLELLRANFGLTIVVGSKEENQVVRGLLEIYYKTCHHLLLCSPFYQPLIILSVAKFYRHRLKEISKRFVRLMACRSKPKIDYGTETMRSIIAENSRSRQFSRFGPIRS